MSLVARVGLGERVRHLAIFGLAWFLAILGLWAVRNPWDTNRLVDANMYWSAWANGLYRADYQLWSFGYSYSPPFAQLIWPLTQLAWPVAGAIWMACAWAAYAWLLWPLPLRLRLPLLLAFGIWSPDNIYWALALVAAIGLRFPAAWALPLLTKISPGVGVPWFAIRREWRNLAICLGFTAAVVAISFCVAPSAWLDWQNLMLRVKVDQTGATPFGSIPTLALRVPLALALIAWGARGDHRWTIPVAMILAQPDINFPVFGILAALPRLGAPRPRALAAVAELMPAPAAAP